MIYLDIEILDWFGDPEIAKLEKWRQHAHLRFGLATTYSAREGFRTWWPDEIAPLYARMCEQPGPIVTWNGDSFDIPYMIVQAVRAGATIDPWELLPPSLDLMALIMRESKRLTGMISAGTS